MSSPADRPLSAQAGFTLVELILTVALGALLMGALISAFLTTSRATQGATGRVEASGQIRNFEYFAYEDFTGSAVTDFDPGCTPSSPCQTQVALTEVKFDNPTQTFTVTYGWDQSAQVLDRTVASAPPLHAAINVTGYQWYLDANNTVVVTLTITVDSYADTQTFRFYPRRNP